MVRVLGLIDDVDMPYFGREKEDSDQQVQLNVTINQGKNMNNDNSRHQSFNGTATNSNVNFGDNSTQTNTIDNQGMSKEEFLQLLQTFKQDLSKSGLPDDTVEEVVSDVEAVEKQLQKTEPNKSIVSRKLESINGVLEDANSSIDTATKGYETFNKIVQAGKILLGGIGFLG